MGRSVRPKKSPVTPQDEPPSSARATRSKSKKVVTTAVEVDNEMQSSKPKPSESKPAKKSMNDHKPNKPNKPNKANKANKPNKPNKPSKPNKTTKTTKTSKTAKTVSVKATRTAGKATRGTKKKTGKTLATKKAATKDQTKNHLLNDEVYAAATADVEANLDEDTHIPASGASVEASHVSAGLWVAAPTPSSLVFTCEDCGKELTTKHGFQRHIMVHRINDANSRRPSAAVLNPLVEGFLLESLSEMKLEFGEEKKIFIESVLESKDSENFHNFLGQIAEPFLENLSTPSRILPANQYEEQLKLLNQILNNKESYDKLLGSLTLLNSNAGVSKHIPGMVLYRLCSKVVDKLVQFVFCEMKEHKCTPEERSACEMKELEKEAFKIHIRKLLQDYYKCGLRYGSQLWLTRCACIRQKFIRSNDMCEPTSVDMVLDNEAWEKDSQGSVKLTLSDDCVKFFLRIEQIIESLLIKKESVTCDNIVGIVLGSRNVDVLETWYSLTMLFFSEVEALVFMRDLIMITTSLSLRLEVGRVRDLTVGGRIQKYALRTDLKRN